MIVTGKLHYRSTGIGGGLAGQLEPDPAVRAGDQGKG